MKVFIKIVNGSSHGFNVEPTDTIEKFRADIFDKRGIPPETDYFLIYKEQKLENEKTFQDYSIPNESKIFLDFNYSFTVKTLAGEEIQIKSNQIESIKNFKAKIQEKTGITPDKYHLFHKGINIEDKKTIYDIFDINYYDTFEMMKNE